MQNNNYCVYKHTCLAHGPSFGKVYIGITGRKPHKRWRSGKNYGHCIYFDNAIKKYGWENFSHEILESGLTRSQAIKAERKYVKQFQANDNRFGFNLTPGGDCLCGAENPTARPVVVFDAESGIRLYDFETGTDADRELDLTSFSALGGKCKTIKGYIIRYLDEVGGMMILPESERFRPKSHPDKNKPVNKYDLAGKYIRTYISVTVAAQLTGISACSISNAARGTSKSAGGFQWRFDNGDQANIERYVSPIEVRYANGNYTGRKIDQIDPNTGKTIKTYNSIREAAREIGGSRTSIRAVADHLPGKKTSKGYRWEYHEE